MKRVTNIIWAVLYGTTLSLYGVDEAPLPENTEASTLEAENVSDRGDFQGEPATVLTTESEGATEPSGESAPLQSWSSSLIQSNPFIPANAKVNSEQKKPVVEETQSLALNGVLKIKNDLWAFSLMDKTSGKSFWLYSDKEDSNLNYYFVHFDENEKFLTLANKFTEEYFSVRMEPKKENKPSSLPMPSYDYGQYSGADFLDDLGISDLDLDED